MYRFIRCAPYKFDSNNLYDSFDGLARQTIDPAIGRDKLTIPTITTMSEIPAFVSPAKRAHQTAQLLRLSPRQLSSLREIEFAMEEIISEEAFLALPEVERVNAARKNFYAKFVQDQLNEIFADVLERIHVLASELLREKQAICISHSFFMKCLESCARHPEVIGTPRKLLSYYDGSQMAYGFLEGFELTSDELRRLAINTSRNNIIELK